MDLRDDEIAADAENTTNKNACSVEETITQLNTTGFTKKEMMIFEAKLQGQYLTIIFRPAVSENQLKLISILN